MGEAGPTGRTGIDGFPGLRGEVGRPGERGEKGNRCSIILRYGKTGEKNVQRVLQAKCQISNTYLPKFLYILLYVEANPV